MISIIFSNSEYSLMIERDFAVLWVCSDKLPKEVLFF